MMFIERIARRLLIWALDRRLARECYFEPHNLYPVIEREIRAIEKTIAAAAEWQVDEIKVLTERLTRRYDVGMAMNEATQRAQEARKKAGLEPEGMPLTGAQKAALRVQQEYLAKIQRY